MATATVPDSDRRPVIALILAVLAVATSLTFFWMYAVPPLLFAVPAALPGGRSLTSPPMPAPSVR